MIVLIGATGFTGQLVARELKELGGRVRLAGRDLARVEKVRQSVGSGFEIAQVDVTSPSAVGAALKDARVVISCAGPFTDVGEVVVREAVRAGAHYLDTTGEQSFIRMVFERYGDEARSKGVALVPACAFEYAFGDAATALACKDLASCQEVDLTYAIEGMQSSRGTRKSILRAIAAPGYALRNGSPVELKAGMLSRVVDVPAQGRRRAYSFPGGEVFMAPLHVSVKDLSTWMTYPVPSLVMKLFALAGPPLMRSPLAGWFSKRIDKGQFGPDAEQRAATNFTIICSARGATGNRRVVVQGTDPYGLTAVLAGTVAQAMMGDDFKGRGCLSPSMVGGPELIRGCTESHGARWLVEESDS
ncbi:MAG TPA: saccharopine dehydrogenase NADP-binding domain-containing protein [Blastocatellia bacterium]|nr:saccharopine dehydrogenase NADP-binding domain-containing protein [Blastocatellia bacterium]